MRVTPEPGYEVLATVLGEALSQAQAGKGKERHASGEPFEDQQIVQLGEWMGTTAFNLGQACKKALESLRLDGYRARGELLGAINYLAAAIVQIDRKSRVAASNTIDKQTQDLINEAHANGGIAVGDRVRVTGFARDVFGVYLGPCGALHRVKCDDGSTRAFAWEQITREGSKDSNTAIVVGDRVRVIQPFATYYDACGVVISSTATVVPNCPFIVRMDCDGMTPHYSLSALERIIK